MAARTIDGPDKDYLTTAEAARYLGVHAQTLVKMAAETDWMRQVYIGSKPRWHWLQVVMMSHILQARSFLAAGTVPKK